MTDQQRGTPPPSTLELAEQQMADVGAARGHDDTLGMSDERLRSAVEAAEVGTWHVDLETGLDARDASMNRLLGLEAVETTQPTEDFFARVHEDDRARARAAFAAAITGEKRYDVELRIRRPNGEVRWVRDVGRVSRAPEGKPLYATGALTDITKLKEAQRAIAQSALFYQQTLESIPGMTFTATSDGSCDYVSRQWVEFTGVDAEALLGEGWLSLLHPDDKGRAVAEWRSSIAGSGEYDLEYRIRRRDGEYEWFKVRGRPIRDASGKLARWLGTALNVNNLKQVEAALREREDALRDADRRKDAYLATLAHELRNPLAPIRAGLDVLERTRDDETRARVEHTIARQLAHLVRLVDDLLEVSRISRGQIDLQRTTIPLSAILETAVETTLPSIERGHHQLMVVVPDEPLWLDGDLTRLSQAVANLIDNAAKYTPEGGRIELHAHVDRGQVVIRVTDTGIGIDREVLPHVFELFTRAAAHGGRAQGLGIGLSLVRDLVRLHGGTVTADSPGPGRGSTFEIRLPLVAPPRSVEVEAEASARARPQREPGSRRILVVDDNVDAAEMLAAMIELHGHETHVAHDGPEALAAARDSVPDVIFLDIGLPGMDGYEVARELRADPLFGETLLVALTGWGTEDDKRRARDAGFDVHLTKPVDVAVVDAVIHRRRGADGNAAK